MAKHSQTAAAGGVRVLPPSASNQPASRADLRTRSTGTPPPLPTRFSRALTVLAIVGVIFGILGILTSILSSWAVLFNPDVAIWNWVNIGVGAVLAIMNLLGSIDCLRGKPSGPRWLRIAACCSLFVCAIYVCAAMRIMLPQIVYTTPNIRARSATLRPTVGETLLAERAMLSALLTLIWAGAVFWITRRRDVVSESK